MTKRVGRRSDAPPANGAASTTRGRRRRATRSKRSDSRSLRGQLKKGVRGLNERVSLDDGIAVLRLVRHERVAALCDERGEVLAGGRDQCSAAVLPPLRGYTH